MVHNITVDAILFKIQSFTLCVLLICTDMLTQHEL